MSFFAHETAVVDDGCQIGEGTRIWHFSHICTGANIGRNCSFGQNTMVAPGVEIGSNVKVQNNVAIYSGTTIEDDVFLGPSCVLTNVSNPRSQVSRKSIYEKTIIRRGATVGANATIVCGITIDHYAFIAAGAVVSKDVPAYGLIVGVPGQCVGWMSRHGHRLNFEQSDRAICPESGYCYQLDRGVVKCLDLSEEDPLPDGLDVGSQNYQEFKESRSR